MRLGLVGYGAIAGQTLAALAQSLERPLDAIVCLARPDGARRARDLLEVAGAALARERIVVNDVAGLLAASPHIVAEAAGHAALVACGAPILSSGLHLIVTSAGALADETLRAALDAAARRGGSRYILCAGAIGGLDILAAARLSGLLEVVYTSRKPPAAWRGTPAENCIDLETLREAAQFFDGTAGEAARQYPQNANVAATLALCGAGFENTRARLIADPAATRNTHEIRILSRCADIEIKIAGVPSPENPKTSMTTGFALATQIRECLNWLTRI